MHIIILAGPARSSDLARTFTGSNDPVLPYHLATLQLNKKQTFPSLFYVKINSLKNQLWNLDFEIWI